jgi:2-dehydro-3-deoxygalactonokinase
MSEQPATLLAVDWGTSSLRGARLGAQGQVLEERSLARGIQTVAPGEFATVFEASFGDWARASGSFCMISGMAGSKQGWVEAPYCPCPAGFDEVAARLTWIDPAPNGLRIAIVPGLSCEHPSAVCGLESIPDVMRGEEVQILGAMQLTGLREGIFVLPGTHNKWARVSEGRVTSFRTFMTGEFYALLSQRSILSKTMDPDAPFDEAAFTQGVNQSRTGTGGLLHNAFSTRTLSLFSRLGASALTSYLSGLIIGEEIQAQGLPKGSSVNLIGAPALTQRYAQALALHGVQSRILGAEATWAGLHALAQTLAATPTRISPQKAH